MTTNKSRGALQVFSNDPMAINDALRMIREELDELQGLRGRAEIHDNLKVADAPIEDDDAVRKIDTIVILGTGFDVFTVGDIFYADAVDTLALLGIGASGTLLVSNGTAPTWGSTVAALSVTGLLAAGSLTVGAGSAVTKVLTATASLDFPNTLAQTSSDLTISVSGAALGDVVLLGVPNGSVNANSGYTAWVSSSGVVTVRFHNYSAAAINPASGTFRATVVQH